MWERLICTCKRSIIRKVKNPQRKESRPHEASQLRCWVPNSWGQDTWGKEDELAMTHPKSWYQTFWTGQGIGALKGYQADEERYQESPCQRGLRYLRFLREPRNCGMRPVELRVCVGPEYMIFMAGGRDVQDPSITFAFSIEHLLTCSHFFDFSFCKFLNL